MFIPVLSFMFLIFVTVVIAIFVYGVMQLWVYFWGKARYGNEASQTVSLFVALSIALIPGALIVYDVATTPSIEWNPIIRSDSAVIGDWYDDGEILILLSDGTYQFSSHSKSSNGIWRRDDWNIRFSKSAEMPYSYLRVIQHSGGYYLLKDSEDGTSDSWIWWNSFSKKHNEQG